MKKCPQCGNVYENNVLYCLSDGTALVEDSLNQNSNDSVEAETVIRHEPIVVDFSSRDESLSAYQPTPAENVVVVPAVSEAMANRNYALFLVIGLLLGGGLVLATLWVSKNFYQTNDSVTVKANVNPIPSATTAIVEKPKASTETQNENATVEPVFNKHSEPNDSADGNTNGRVIALNARIRLAPDKDAPIVDTLPMKDRIEIIRRQSSSSPWYQVECEHGTSGWMHGDTIEFTQ
jgi:hypothetical protein